jgi:NTP pyrophosphatase (non-canonical NTP hydrolase)
MDKSLEALRQMVIDFSRRRDWEKFHNPKNLSMALIAEAGELIEHFQWMDAEASNHLSKSQHQAVTMELADILIYLVRIADRLDVNLIDAGIHKMRINEQRFPVPDKRG